MDVPKRILIAGEGHLSFQVFRKLKERGFDPRRVETNKSEGILTPNNEHSLYEHYKQKFESAGIHEADVVYLIDDEDKLNIQFFLIASSLNPTAKLVVSLFNDNLAPYLRAGHKLLEVHNPAGIAAAEFAQAAVKKLSKTKKIQTQATALPQVRERYDQSLRSALFGITFIFSLIIVLSTIVFHVTEGLTWINAFYFTATILTTTGFGDITLLNASPIVKLFGIALMFVGVSFISIAFSFIVEWLLSRRAELALGRKQYTFQNHIILCGLGRLGYHVTLELMRRGEKVLVIESDANNRYIDLVRGSGVQVLVADSSLARNLRLANLGHAKSLLSVMQDDLKNLEIGLVAKSLEPRLSLVLRIFDHDIAQEMQRRLSIPVALSASSIAAEYLLEKM